jgi:acyl-CoA synthetase (AMP-forming)/AMP-acid ligase II
MAGSGRSRTYGQLDERSRRLAAALHQRGLRPGDHLAVLLDNRPEYFEAVWAGLRSGLYVTPINWHLTPEEAAFIVSDCGADALVAGADLASVAETADGTYRPRVQLAVDGDAAGFEAYDAALADADLTVDVAECEGQWMFYSSGTTGRPKGIVPGPVGAPMGTPSSFTQLLTGLFGFTGETTYLSPAPLYHAAPAGWTTGTQRIGGTVVVMEHFDPVELLAAIERHRVTHLQVVPTHLVRLLKLPHEQRDRFDLSSLRMVVHAAAPCPIETKRAAIDWLGPIVHEYYAGSEGNGFCAIGSKEWLAHPGSVGRSLLGAIHIVDDAGNEVPVGSDGQVWFESPRRFSYHGDPDKTAAAWDDERGWSTIGDIGRLDDEGYLYLTDRASNMIISGGVNIYPQEIEDLLLGHPWVLDAAVIGTPDPDLGEQVTAFVLPDRTVVSEDDLDTMPALLIAHCRDHLAHFKCPRRVEIVQDLPRLPTGKLLKRLLR